MTLPEPREIRAHDGTPYRLRPIRPGDAPSLIRVFDAMPARSRWFRFLRPLPHLPPDMAARWCSPDPRREVCLVVEGRDALEGDILGGARVAELAAGGIAEFAVSMRPEAEGMGLARQATEAVIEVARARGAAGIRGCIAAENSWMLGLARRLDMTVTPDAEDHALRVARLDFASG
ncbi:GNAT family N-acetyltransferase [Mangrovicoccus algicola]|uniref:GNAT family N-acetyltransferase n=1 Tax=Mangrovicoccus algicola TaxID=2771008 RepID=A0A8J6YQ24_9RHOB|nr:GNAT family N-acetyltransferase [Mangrovicoccus algicola]MBE3637413.1 GNAT family N-acetyltransferase [Mangrovicoccus algicola]